MKVVCILLVVFVGGFKAQSQAVFTTTGNWELPTNWSGSNIGDLLTENVSINNNRAALINNGSSYTIGDLTFGNNTGLTINTLGTLDLGASGTPKTLTAGNTVTITVAGQLTVWGDLNVINNLSLAVSGSLVVKGNLQMNNNASISVLGDVQVDGDFIAGNNALVSIVAGGHVNVDGAVTVGDNSNLLGLPGSFTTSGCTQGSSSTFCTSAALPVVLLYFRAEAGVDRIHLLWETASEKHADYFLVEKSGDGLTFTEIVRIRAAGNSTERVRYSVDDEKPYAGLSYYRLKQVDEDGASEMLGVVLVDFNGLRSSNIYPNPVRNGGELNVVLNFDPTYPLDLAVYDLTGRLVERMILTKSAINLPIVLSKGLYFVRLSSPEYQGINRFSVND